MTAPGSAYACLRRALDHGNLTEALSAASEMEHVGLVEALELCLLLCDQAPEKYGRAALRWHGGYCRETNGLEEAQLDTRVFVTKMPHHAPAVSMAMVGNRVRRDRFLSHQLPSGLRAGCRTLFQ